MCDRLVMPNDWTGTMAWPVIGDWAVVDSDQCKYNYQLYIW